MVNAIKLAIGDAVLTFIWIFISSTLGLITTEILKAFDLEFVTYNGVNYPFIIITTLLIFVIIFTFTAIGNAMGGASFNPTGNASFYAAGLGSDTLFSMALRFPAQVKGFSFFVNFQFLDLGLWFCVVRVLLFCVFYFFEFGHEL